MALTWRLSTVRGRAVDVVVHRTAAQMRRGARQFSGGTFEPDCQGVTHGFTGPHTPQAVIRLSEECLTWRVIIHELVHAAQAIYGMDYGEMIERHPLEHWSNHNETFAHIVTELQGAMAQALAANGLTPSGGFAIDDG